MTGIFADKNALININAWKTFLVLPDVKTNKGQSFNQHL